MKAIVQERYGSANELKLTEIDKPAPADNEVLVRVYAAAVNAADWHTMRGDPKFARLSLGLNAPKAKEGSGPARQAPGSGPRFRRLR